MRKQPKAAKLDTELIVVNNRTITATVVPVVISSSTVKLDGCEYVFTRRDTGESWTCLLDSRIELRSAGRMTTILTSKSGYQVFFVGDRHRELHEPFLFTYTPADTSSQKNLARR